MHAGATSVMVACDDNRYPCVSLCCYKDMVIGGYGSGHIKLNNLHNGALVVEVSAHAQWITALHLAPRASLVSVIT